MKYIYIIFDELHEEIADIFLSRNDKAAISDTTIAFNKSATADSHLSLHKVGLLDTELFLFQPLENGDTKNGGPTEKIWDSEVALAKLEEESKKE